MHAYMHTMYVYPPSPYLLYFSSYPYCYLLYIIHLFFLSVPQLLLQSEYKLPKSIVLIYFIHCSIPIVQNTV